MVRGPTSHPSCSPQTFFSPRLPPLSNYPAISKKDLIRELVVFFFSFSSLFFLSVLPTSNILAYERKQTKTVIP